MGCSNDHEKPNLNERVTKPTEENKNINKKIKNEKQSVIKTKVIRVQSIRNNENINNNNESNNNNEEKNNVITIKNNNYLYLNNNNNNNNENNEYNKEDILTLYH